MEADQTAQAAAANAVLEYAADLLVTEKMEPEAVVEALEEKGLEKAASWEIVRRLVADIETERQERAQKDMLYGALWCIGGIVATVANFGYFFWGAILFGAWQFLRGVVANSK